jgi:hypothetical protein
MTEPALCFSLLSTKRTSAPFRPRPTWPAGSRLGHNPAWSGCPLACAAVRPCLIAANVQDTGVALAAGIEGVVEDVAMPHVDEVDDDKVAREGAGGLALRDGMSPGGC